MRTTVVQISRTCEAGYSYITTRPCDRMSAIVRVMRYDVIVLIEYVLSLCNYSTSFAV